MDDGYSLLGVIIFMLFIVMDAVLYGFGAALQNLNVTALEKEAEEGGGKAGKLLHILDNPSGVVYSIHILSHLMSFISGAYVLAGAEYYLRGLLESTSILPAAGLKLISLVITTILMLVVLISFGVIIPKKCAKDRPERWAYGLLGFMGVISIPLLPFVYLIRGLSYVVLRLMGKDPRIEVDNVTEEDIMSMVNEGHEQGVLLASEAEMITNIFEFDEKEAGDIMTHRKNLTALDGSMTLRDTVSFILKECNNSRFPVYGEDMDDIIGVLHMKDAIIRSEQNDYQDVSIREIDGLLREAHFIPETRNINSLFKEMQSQKIHMEIVVDEYGQTAGIVTMEDILEEIVGNILDEYDVDEEHITAQEDGSFLMNGMTPLDDAAKALEIEFEEEDEDAFDTMNGFLISRLGRIPKEGEEPEIEYHGYKFKVLKAENKMIHTFRADKQSKDEAQTEE